jgi:anti-sigma B factor antagonist
MNAGPSAVDKYAPVGIDVSRANGAVVVTVSGDADLHSAPELRDRLRTSIADASLVVVDLSGATFLDSMALGVLLAARKNAEEHGKRLEIVAGTPEIRRIFEITMLDRVFELHATRAQAIGDGV